MPGFSPPVWAGEIPVRREKNNNIVRHFSYTASSEQKFRYVVFAEMSPRCGWSDSCQDSHFESAVGFGWQFLEGIA